jgi:Xaa-Pro aminopeptidase
VIDIEPRLRALLAPDYPRFSDAEFAHRRAALAAAMRQADVGHLLVCGEQRAGSGVFWLTGWPVTAEALVVFTPGERELMFVEWYNHVPLATRLARDADVHWGAHAALDKAVEALRARGARRVGVVGPLGWRKARRLEAAFEALVDMNAGYTRLRLVKSEEEIDWLRVGAAYSDAAIAALQRELRPGLTERDLCDVTERAYTPHGGTTYIHYFGATAMAAPDCCVPRQFPANRRLAAGDVVFTEVSGAFWDYPGQVLRTFAVDAEPTPLYRDLHAVAEAAFDAVAKVLRRGATMREIVDAAGVIEDAGYTACDDLLHGFGGGYLPPVLGSRSRPAGPLPDMVLEQNMTVVVQPNVVTRDHKAGVQVGELLRVTGSGCERLHAAPRGFLRAVAR